MIRRNFLRHVRLGNMCQSELRLPFTKDDKPVQSSKDEFAFPEPNQEMMKKHGRYAQYVSPEHTVIKDLDERAEVLLNEYPNGDTKGLTFDQYDPKKITTEYYATCDENFFRKFILKPKGDTFEKDRVTDMMLNASLTGFSLLMMRYLLAPIWWAGLPPMTMINQANLEIDLGNIPEKDYRTVVWRGKPIFVYHRSDHQVDQVRETPMSELKHPERDEDRFPTKASHSVVIAICTHLGCIPNPNDGIYMGYFCPCHGSHYDISGRIRIGPAPLNLEVPPYKWLDEQTLYIGT
ncbi:reiske iron-sulfur protein precursor [Perkinsela sp. CCAP 1560/4]|nr:reiske iron-sulfur protein precursor [Perkinsela sp. CCAP 1560/4]|eukprot:KNH04013.1 reiske iron-sulfur protein precursor [Perkinsela sp. CCAP 1560/4]